MVKSSICSAHEFFSLDINSTSLRRVIVLMSSADTPDLEDLLFYQQLTSNFADLYDQAQESCSFMVIPLNVSYGSLLTRDTVASHLFRPSPLYTGKHVSLNDRCELEFDDNRAIRVSYKKKGAGEKLFKIVSQEDVRYSQRQRNYSFLVVEQPLIDINAFKSPHGNLIARTPSNPPVSSTRRLIQLTCLKGSAIF